MRQPRRRRPAVRAPALGAVRGWVGHGTDLLLRTLRTLPDADLDGPSALPGWTRRYLLAHLVANADALRNLAAWARTGVETPMYASPAQRERDIATGAPWPRPSRGRGSSALPTSSPSPSTSMR